MTRIIILAAGKGTRMNSELPKVLVPLNGRPMIKYLMDSVKAAAIDPRPIIVVSPDNKNVISRELSDYDLEYAVQTEQLGTGHAVACARDFLSDETKNILVLYGDHPFIKTESIKNFASTNPEALTMMTTSLPDFNDWRQNFYHWGRIVRSANGTGTIETIIEFKDASEEQKTITEVNPALMCFNKKWLLENIDKLRDDNKQKEYYLTDMVKLAFNQGHRIETININPREAIGVNSLEELKNAVELMF